MEGPGPPSRKHLRAKIQIGNSQGAITYDPNQTVFRHDDIKVDTRQRVQDVKKWAKNSVLEEQNDWNKSTFVDKTLCERKTMENFVRDRNNVIYNYRSEVMPPKVAPLPQKLNKFQITMANTQRVESEGFANPIETLNRIEEYPINAKLGEAKWNLSTEVTKKDLNSSFNAIANDAKLHSQKVLSKFIPKARHIGPMERSIKLQEEVRAQKKKGSFTVTRPVFAEEEQPVNRKELVNRCAVEVSLKYKTTHHTGTWALNPEEGRHMWSDTGSFEYESPGDTVKVHNPDAYIFSRPTLAK